MLNLFCSAQSAVIGKKEEMDEAAEAANGTKFFRTVKCESHRQRLHRTKARVIPRWVKQVCTGECGCKYTHRVRSVKLIIVLQREHLKSLWMCF